MPSSWQYISELLTGPRGMSLKYGVSNFNVNISQRHLFHIKHFDSLQRRPEESLRDTIKEAVGWEMCSVLLPCVRINTYCTLTPFSVSNSVYCWWLLLPSTHLQERYRRVDGKCAVCRYKKVLVSYRLVANLTIMFDAILT